MNRRVLTREAFDGLLDWLDPNRDQAGKKYESIRRRIIKILACRGCCEAEDLADETFNRVASKVHEIASSYTGDPALYFYGVAHKVHLEYLRRKPPLASPPLQLATGESSNEIEQEYACLERCIERLPDSQRDLVLEYYKEDKRAKIDHRKELADKLGVALNALRIRAYRIRAALQQCVEDCLEQKAIG
jgi:RNA polymerase sigma factor (sigma-70 family)